jgi:hypothetical protein
MLKLLMQIWRGRGFRRASCGWLAVGLALVAAIAPAAQAASPVISWDKGDWWEVQLHQMPLHMGVSREAWVPSYRLRFEVTDRSAREVRVEVNTIPQNRFEERLVLRYTPAGELLSAEVVDPQRVHPLGPAGSFGVFGMLGREAFILSKAPAAGAGRAGVRSATSRVALDPDGRTAQTWRPGEAFWRLYESTVGAPQRATLAAASWQQAGGRDGSRR